MLSKLKWGIPGKFCPSPIEDEDVSATYAKSLKFHLLFAKFSWKFRVRKQKSVDFERLCDCFFQKSVLKEGFLFKKLEIQDYILPKTSLEIKSHLFGEGAFFFSNSPM